MQPFAIVRNIRGQEGVLFFPETGRLVRLHRRSANLLNENTADGQRRVAQVAVLGPADAVGLSHEKGPPHREIRIP